LKSYFNIKATIPKDHHDPLWLILQYGEGINGYLIYHPKDLTVVKSQLWEADAALTDPKQIIESVQTDAETEIPFSKTILINYNPTYFNLPGFLYQSDKIDNWIKLTNGKDLNEKVITKRKKDSDIIHIHSINHKFFELLSHHYRDIDIYSFQEFAHRQQMTNEIVINLTFFHQHMYVCLHKEGNLHLNQAFKFSTPEDALYNLLNIVEQFSIDRTKSVMIPEGFIDADSAMYKLLDQYFPNIQKPENLTCLFPAQAESISPYILRHIDRLILCVS
jgi:hypothetical protein